MIGRALFIMLLLAMASHGCSSPCFENALGEASCEPPPDYFDDLITN